MNTSFPHLVSETAHSAEEVTEEEVPWGQSVTANSQKVGGVLTSRGPFHPWVSMKSLEFKIEY